MSVDEVFEAIAELQHQYVVLTGGEPMLFSEMVPLCERLHENGNHIRSRRPVRFLCHCSVI